MEYIEWRACERWGLIPRNIKTPFEENTPWMQAKIVAYEQIRQAESF